jgi:NADPH:quinone reductase-like Zn-dependent oxidoreductase
MKSYRWGTAPGIAGLELHEGDVPQPQRGEVLVKVRAVSLNFRDVPAGKPSTSSLVPVSDAAGQIEAVGEGVTRFRAGDRVINAYHADWIGGPYPARAKLLGYGVGQNGWLSEYRVVPQHALVAIPDSWGYEQAATLPCAAVTAWTALGGPTRIKAGDNVLVLGSGGVSIFALQIARALGATVVATTSSSEKADRLGELGAAAVVNYRDHPEWSKQVRAATNDEGVHRVVEVGGPATIRQSLASLARRSGEIALIGFAGGGSATIDFWELMGSGGTVRWIGVGSRTDTEDLVAFLTAHHIMPVIDGVFGFDEAPTAFARLKSGQHLGKVVISL